MNSTYKDSSVEFCRRCDRRETCHGHQKGRFKLIHARSRTCDVKRDAIYGCVSVRREGDDTNTLFNCATSSASPPCYFVVGDSSERDVSQMRYKRLTWADDQSSAAPQSIFDVTASEILLPSKRQIFRQTPPNDGFQRRYVECRSQGSICQHTKEFQGRPHSMKAGRRLCTARPVVAVTSSDPGTCFGTGR